MTHAPLIRASDKPVIRIETRMAYGRRFSYPVCEKAQIFADMLGQKTLTPETLQRITALGFTVIETKPAS